MQDETTMWEVRDNARKSGCEEEDGHARKAEGKTRDRVNARTCASEYASVAAVHLWRVMLGSHGKRSFREA